MIRRAGPIVTGLLISAGSLTVMASLLLGGELLVRMLLPERCDRVRQEAEMVAASRSYLMPCFVSERISNEDYLVTLSAPGREALRLPHRKRPGVARIAVVGESSADLLARQLAELLSTASCRDRYEVLNCAQPGSALEHVERRFDEVLGYEPDAVVLLFGHNISFRFPLDEQRLRLEGLRARSCLLSQFAAAAPPDQAPSLANQLTALDQFLRRAAAATRARGIAFALATMPANLWLPPGASPNDEYEPRFLKAQFLEARGQRDTALPLLEALASEHDLPFWHYQLGEQLARAGVNDGRAYRELHRALDADGIRTRAPAQVNDLLRTVAAEEGLLLRDTERVVEARAPAGLPGWETFVDNCHLLPSGFDREAEAVLALLRDAAKLPVCDNKPTGRFRKDLHEVLDGVFNLTASGPDDLARRWYRGLALAVESWVNRDPHGADRDVDAFVGGLPFTTTGDQHHASRLLVAIAEGYYRAGQHARAFALNERARAGGATEAWVQKGVFHLRQNEPRDARRAFEHALSLDGSRQDARSFLRWLAE
jgi:tetratricopeptide (TPR) repeat protein